ncbi:NAD(P)H-hydrate dehydratase [Streptomyces scabiei]|uniref:NAD(P)H-hydrate dehydratase n=2 Tax=Streptomyces scabiei TaxID=1930 RepID=UPI000B0A0184|nr:MULTISPECIES: NAD(P)H-hydrate dehydratase [Streptomyces]MDX2534450.1 NAD(P)H-hydrate dehydratase [Streptomyces scabiei]MDX2798840.1 NAD(P)H-hydrate dehydratase [Streptomyces scabiei]MDX2831747.1 NAD(P)H-hydrate dehydratase [Streptomyces scabiei]MDX3221944.1 NAD(P)H-hydrate dehydratase [Streptomyces scabiei]MDX3299004.1 NAD(P)H-hydrate dehydratase [Streptomyces scabiei]
MRSAHRVETVRTAERTLMARLPDGALMQRAAAGLAAACADILPRRVYGSRVVVLTGSGDNGGDALYAGARLARRGAGVTAVLLSPDRTHQAALHALLRAGGTTATPTAADAHIRRADLVLDGVVGIGGKGGLRPEAARLAALAAASPATVVAVDLPSGIEADTGEVYGEAVRADLTVTFGTHKPGLLVDPARTYAGSVRLVDIGLADTLPATPALESLQHTDVAALLPRPSQESDKYRRGVVGIAAGSARYPGAAVLAVAGALRGGAGAVRYVGAAGDAVLARFPETLVSDTGPKKAGRVQAWVAGPGAGDDPAPVAEALSTDVPVLLDADGLRLADRESVRTRTAPTLLTPHAGEAAALLGISREEVEASRLTAVRDLARAYDATVLLKGSTTLIATPDPGTPVRVNATGTPWLATAGSGDVLSGLAGSLLAAGLSPLDAASAAAYVHGLAGRYAADGAPAGAHDVAESIPAAWRDITA